MRFLFTFFRRFTRSKPVQTVSDHGHDEILADPHTVLMPLIARDEWTPVSEAADREIQSDEWIFEQAPTIELIRREHSSAMHEAGASFARLREVVNRVAAASPIDAPVYTKTEATMAANVHEFLFEPQSEPLEIFDDVEDLFDTPLAEIDVPLLVAAQQTQEHNVNHLARRN